MTSNPSPVYNGRYELRSQIARGGTAQVYLARDLLLDRPVALKVLFPELSADHAFVERFRREAQAAANLSHPNIVPVFDWGESDRTHFIVMEYVDGEPLSAIIRRSAPLPPVRSAQIASDIAKALSYAHRHGVVHRDVKPGNVLITSDGLVKVTDFGIARAMGADEQVTQTGLVMGTATYFSPEQAQGLGVDGRSDVYALGVVLYEMLTGRPPFTGENPVAIAYQHVREHAPSPSSLNPAIPPALETIVLQAMAKDPAERYGTADDLRADLDRFVRGQTVLAKAPGALVGTEPATSVLRQYDTSVVETVPAEVRERSTTPWWLLAGLLLLIAIGLVVYFGGRSLGYWGGPSYVTVPDVTGMKLAKAESTLKSDNLKWSVTPVKGTKAQSGTVKSQSVKHPSQVRSGKTIGLVEWSYHPPTRVTVPSVAGVGLSYDAARQTLTSAGFKVAPAHDVPATSPSEKQGTVIGESPKGGSTADAHTTVTLDVVSGSSYVTVPTGIQGDSRSAATKAISAAGLKVASQTRSQLSATVPSGGVITTQPAPGTPVKPGATVVLVLSNGGVVVPSVAGYSPSYAEQLLSSKGFTDFIEKNSDSLQYPTGSVAATAPASGSLVQPTHPIVLYVVGESSTTTSTSTTSTTSTTTSTTLPATTFPTTSLPTPSGP